MKGLLNKINRYTGFTKKAIDNIFTKGHFVFGVKFLVAVHVTIILRLISQKPEKRVISLSVEGNTLYMYNTLVSFLIIDEIRTRKLYSPFIGCKKILDLGGYLGESAVYFAKHTAQVDIYEADKRNYKVLLQNCSSLPSIRCFYGAVISGNRVIRFAFDNEDRGTVSEVGEEIIPTYDFITLLKNETYDGIKIDIEGGEYEILDNLLKSDVELKATHFFIEFHEVDKNEMRAKIQLYVSYLVEKGYTYTVFDNDHSPILLNEIADKKISFVNFFFQK